MPRGTENIFRPKEKPSKPDTQSNNTTDVNKSNVPKSKPKSANVNTPEQQRNKAVIAAVSDMGGARNVQGIIIKDVSVGSGAVAQRGKRVTVHYCGKLQSGKIFDASKKPFQFGLGYGEVIRGWDIGVEGMKVGGKRNLTIPAPLAYGKSGAPPTIPPNATLIFDVTLVSVK